jgi:hypothetical protein
LEAAKRLGRPEVPTLTIAGLNPAEKRAVVIADNRLPEQAVWDFELLREHFYELIKVDFDVELSGFSTGEVDLMLDGKATQAANDPADDLTGLQQQGPAVSQLGDVWDLGRHRQVCGDALQGSSYELLLRGETAQMVVSDPPYNVPIAGHAMGRGQGTAPGVQDGLRRDVRGRLYRLPREFRSPGHHPQRGRVDPLPVHRLAASS